MEISMYETNKIRKTRKKFLFRDAPVLDEEYGAAVISKERARNTRRGA
jgi:hypothetical protein